MNEYHRHDPEKTVAPTARASHKPDSGGHGAHDHAAMIADFKRRFWISLVLTVPILLLSPMIQDFLRLGAAFRFAGAGRVLFALSTVVFFYGGWPFLTGFVSEIRARRTGMMTLISMTITVAYLYSTATVFGLAGEPFFWELATLIDVMLLGHWIEMRSVMGASAALEALVKLMPATADRLKEDGSTEEVQVAELKAGDRVLVRPGAKVPTDMIVNSAIFILFAFSFFKPHSARDWRSFGAFSAFVVALFTEMYGFPLTIFLLSGWLQSRYPGVDWLSHDAGHLLEMLFGWKANPHFGPFHLLSFVLIGAGFMLIGATWRALYAPHAPARSRRQDHSRTSGTRSTWASSSCWSGSWCNGRRC